MKTLIIAGVTAFGLGAAGGTGYRMATAPPRTPVVFSATVAEEGEQGEAPGATEATPVEESSDQVAMPGIENSVTSGQAVPETTLPKPPAGAVTAQAERPVTRAPAKETAAEAETNPSEAIAESTGGAAEGGNDPAEFKQLAKILANMKAVEAGRILEHLTDEQVASVFASMNPRAAALVLAEIPPERGASVGRILAARAKSGK
jgi:hypothetical protein